MPPRVLPGHAREAIEPGRRQNIARCLPVLLSRMRITQGRPSFHGRKSNRRRDFMVSHQCAALAVPPGRAAISASPLSCRSSSSAAASRPPPPSRCATTGCMRSPKRPLSTSRARPRARARSGRRPRSLRRHRHGLRECHNFGRNLGRDFRSRRARHCAISPCSTPAAAAIGTDGSPKDILPLSRGHARGPRGRVTRLQLRATGRASPSSFRAGDHIVAVELDAQAL